MATWNNLGYTAKDRNPMYQTGKKLLTVHAQAPIDVSEVANGDVWVLAQVSLTSRVHRIVVGKSFVCDAAADNDFGFYRKVNGGRLLLMGHPCYVYRLTSLWFGCRI